MPEPITETAVLEALKTVDIPELRGDLLSKGLARDVKICEGNVAFELLLPGPLASLKERIESACRRAVAEIPGVTSINVRWKSLALPSAPAQAGNAQPAPNSLVPGVKHVIAVGSGKGGVGKSTVAANLAVALALEGHEVGLLDADVYGPSQPQMMGIREAPLTHNGKLLPLERHGVRLMSLGFLMPDDQAHVIWRGPMVGGAVAQMLRDCEWGNLDFLVVDLPPGTGDAQLTLAQSVPLSGAVVVMTSQGVAVNIAAKAVGMFRRLNVPILGVVGNMDSFACPCCGTQTPIFTTGGSEVAAAQLGVPFLGSIPLDPATVTHGDEGTPTVLAAADSAQAQAFRQVAQSVIAALTDEADTNPDDPFGGLLSS